MLLRSQEEGRGRTAKEQEEHWSRPGAWATRLGVKLRDFAFSNIDREEQTRPCFGLKFRDDQFTGLMAFCDSSQRTIALPHVRHVPRVAVGRSVRSQKDRLRLQRSHSWSPLPYST